MANWCETKYVFTGSRDALGELYDFLKELENCEESSVSNDFGTTWLGNIVNALGYDWHNIKCRGYWEDIWLNSTLLAFTVWSAWIPPYDIMEILKEKFTGVKYYYYAEEKGCGIFETNDFEGRFFPERYIVLFNDGLSFFCEHFVTIDESIQWLNEHSGYHSRELRDIEDYFHSDHKNGDKNLFCNIVPVNVLRV